MNDYSELNLKAQAAIDAIGTLSRAQRERNFNDACTPQVVQALIAENERLKMELECAQLNLSIAVGVKDSQRSELDEVKAENEKLREEVALDDKLIADRDRLLNMFECPAHGQCIPYAMEQVEALRKDAERYRWLRLADWWRSPICVIRNPKEQAKLGSDCPTGERLDSAVDAAMSNGDKP